MGTLTGRPARNGPIEPEIKWIVSKLKFGTIVTNSFSPKNSTSLGSISNKPPLFQAAVTRGSLTFLIQLRSGTRLARRIEKLAGNWRSAMFETLPVAGYINFERVQGAGAILKRFIEDRRSDQFCKELLLGLQDGY